MLTNLLSKSQNDIHGRTFPLDEVVLVPTRATAAVLLSTENLDGNGETCSSPEATQTQIPDARKNQITLVSSILDLSIGGVSLKDSRSLESAAKFVDTIFTADGEYRSATLHLESCSISMGRSDGGIIAESQVVKTLCGGVEPGELIRDGPGALERVSFVAVDH
jgi:hypothetical protein